MKVIFMGTPDFAAVCLRKLTKHHDVVAVFSQPDKKVGRKQLLTPTDTKVVAQELNIPVFQPEKLRDENVIETVKSFNADVIAVVAYGKILPKAILEASKFGCINVHGSLLPKYRGAAPIQWSVINGEEETGVTTMFMNEGLDTGDMLLKETVKIGETETSGELFDRLADIGAKLLVTTLEKLEKGELKPEKQDDSLSSYAPLLDKSICAVDFNASAKSVCSKINGLSPWPCATVKFNGEILKVYRAKICDVNGTPSSLLNDKQLIVACNDKSVRLLEVQFSGSKKMTDEDFLRGHKLPIGFEFNKGEF